MLKDTLSLTRLSLIVTPNLVSKGFTTSFLNKTFPTLTPSVRTPDFLYLPSLASVKCVFALFENIELFFGDFLTSYMEPSVTSVTCYIEPNTVSTTVTTRVGHSETVYEFYNTQATVNTHTQNYNRTAKHR